MAPYIWSRGMRHCRDKSRRTIWRVGFALVESLVIGLCVGLSIANAQGLKPRTNADTGVGAGVGASSTADDSGAALNKRPRISLNAGVKLWGTAWSSWVTGPKATGVALGSLRYQTVQAVGSSAQWSTIPFANLRVNDFFVSTSAMVPTHYTLRDAATPGGFSFPAARREFDVNAGYYVLPGLAVYGGFKELRQSYGPDTFKWRGLLLGLNGSAPLSRGWAFYGNMAIGRMQAYFPASQADISGRTQLPTSYHLGEFGLAYIPPWIDKYSTPALLTIGYRAQQASTQGYSLAVTDTSGASVVNTSTTLNDTTQGWVVSLVVNF